ncbi:MAG TPA: RDD family protein [Thermoanaerobaculia bacterium]|nr:RDD family protein [Thermoanaerobaculia bacterium]
MSDAALEPDRGLYGLDNVRLELPIALAGSRSLAALVDYTLLGVLAAALVSGALVAAVLAGTFESAAVGWVFALGLLGLFVLEAGYFAIQEIAMGGQTLGKRLVGLRAVALRGGRATPLALLLRNLLRSLDLLFGMWLLLFDPRGRRIGDRLAGTLVVHEPPQGVETDTVSRLPAGWGPERIEAVEALLAALDGLAPERAEELSRRVLELAERDQPDFVWPGTPGSSATTRLRASFARRPEVDRPGVDHAL